MCVCVCVYENSSLAFFSWKLSETHIQFWDKDLRLMAQIKCEGKTKDMEIHYKTFCNKNPRALGNRTQKKKN